MTSHCGSCYRREQSKLRNQPEAGIFIEKISGGGGGGTNQDFLKLRGASLVSRLSCVELIIAHLRGQRYFEGDE